MVSALVLAGGKSSRMNYQNKAYLEWKGKYLIEYIVGELEKVADEILISQSRQDKHIFPQYRAVYDRGDSFGPISGMEAALSVCYYDKLLVTACDMPGVNASLFLALLESAGGYDAVVPVISGRYQPLAAVYDKRILPLVRMQIKEEKYSLHRLLDQLNVCYIDEKYLGQRGLVNGEILFSNINTALDYERIKKEDNRHMK